MGSLVTYRVEGPAVRIGMDDGKLNVLSPQMLAELHEAFERAGGEGLPVEELAVWADTIPYELLCGISQRVAVTLL